MIFHTQRRDTPNRFAEYMSRQVQMEEIKEKIQNKKIKENLQNDLQKPTTRDTADRKNRKKKKVELSKIPEDYEDEYVTSQNC